MTRKFSTHVSRIVPVCMSSVQQFTHTFWTEHNDFLFMHISQGKWLIIRRDTSVFVYLCPVKLCWSFFFFFKVYKSVNGCWQEKEARQKPLSKVITQKNVSYCSPLNLQILLTWARFHGDKCQKYSDCLLHTYELLLSTGWMFKVCQ